MPQFEEASPICRGKNLSWETILLFYNNMPREAMPKADFNAYTEARINAWTQTHSQIARQLAFYYEENGICYPRFTKEMSYKDLFAYMQNWAAKYFIPNPYAPSLKGYTPTCIYAYLIESINLGKTDFDSILDSIFGVKLSSHDKVRVYLSNFTDLIIDGNRVSINERALGIDTLLNPDIDCSTDVKKYFDYFSIESEVIANNNRPQFNGISLQQIFYGAPGTGKSHTIKKETKGEDVIRTTFHPDTDYSSFVGAYKPTTIEVPVMTIIGKEQVPVENAKPEKKIVYEFVSQAFLQAYVKAWIKYAEAGMEKPKKQYLVIEEINRGNCAQIFGDLFQLLDRNSKGFSDYPITADADMKKQLKGLFDGYIIEDKEAINAYYDGRDIVDEVLNGDILLLPNNLYIWATMNTSDQSLFPIDSAFKRRWNWQYIPISNRQKGYKIEVNGSYYDWWEFLNAINGIIWDTNHSEDKKLGYFFVKSDDTIIKSDVFVGKVIFYLWNDVFKDFIDEAGSLFNDANDTQLSFDKFYDTDNTGRTYVVDAKVEQFLKNLKLTPCGEVEDVVEVDETEDGEATTTEREKGQRDKSFYSINGEGKHIKKRTPFEAVSLYVRNNPEMLAQEIVDTWLSLETIIRHIVITSEEYKEKLSKTSDGALEKRYYSLTLKSGETIYVYNQFNPERINDFMTKVNAQNWNIRIEKVEE